MIIRKLLICKKPENEIERKLKEMYLRRVIEMFKRSLTLESTFNIFDEIFHGLSKISLVSKSLYSFYESLLTITSYYQHSQAGRGSLVAKLLEKLGTSEKMKFEYPLKEIPQLLGQNKILKETELTRQKFDIINKSECNLVLCELKMKVYSGCTAGRIELMQKFNKFTKLIIENQSFRECIKNSGVKNIFLIGGVLFDIQGEPATTQKDEEWGICYNGLLRGRNDIIKTLNDMKIEHKLNGKKIPEKAFIIEFVIDGVNVQIIAAYGNEVIRKLFTGKQKHDIKYFKNLMEKMLYDDLWLAQIIAISERTILDQYFKKNKKLNNYLTLILKNDNILAEINKFRLTRNDEKLEEVTLRIIKIIKNICKNLLEIRPIPAEIIFKSSGEDYDIKNYIADLVQFLSCKNVIKNIK